MSATYLTYLTISDLLRNYLGTFTKVRKEKDP